MPVELTLQPMQAQDLELVKKWLDEPHVAKWYLAGFTLEEELKDLRESITGETATHPLLALERDRPIGWGQWYLCSDYPEHAAGVRARDGDVGIDYAIGDPQRIGRGAGTALIAALVAHVRQRRPAAAVTADPQATNVGSRRALEKNGFRLAWQGPVASEPIDADMAIYRLEAPT
jgi:aminoglycoside 6'-N-acetyltransferase